MATVIVTGASGGIGKAIMSAFAEQGHQVLGLDLKGPVDQCPDRIRLLDITDYQAVIHADLPTPDVLVNCAGITRDRVCWKMDPQDWQAVLNVNLTGAFNLVRALAPGMKARGSGTILNISSINARRGKFGQSNYVAAKAGLEALTRNWALELGSFGIRVNAVAPGMVETPLTRSLPQEVLARAAEERALPFAPVPEDIADAVLFLASDRARCITGITLRVDSGQCISP